MDDNLPVLTTRKKDTQKSSAMNNQGEYTQCTHNCNDAGTVLKDFFFYSSLKGYETVGT